MDGTLVNAKGDPYGLYGKGVDPEDILKCQIRDQAMHECWAKAGLLFPRVYYSGGTGMILDGSTIWGIYYFRGIFYWGGVTENIPFSIEP